MTISLVNTPASRSQMIWIPKKTAMNRVEAGKDAGRQAVR